MPTVMMVLVRRMIDTIVIGRPDRSFFAVGFCGSHALSGHIDHKFTNGFEFMSYLAKVLWWRLMVISWFGRLVFADGTWGGLEFPRHIVRFRTGMPGWWLMV